MGAAELIGRRIIVDDAICHVVSPDAHNGGMTTVTSPRAGPDPASLDRKLVRRAGFAAMAVSTALMWLASSLFEGVIFPPAALADLIIRAVPGDVSTFFIDALKHWSLRLLILGVLAGSLIFGAELLWRRSRDGRLRTVETAIAIAVLGGGFSLGSASGTGNFLVTGIVLALAALAYAGVAGSVYATSAAPVDVERRNVLRVGFGGALTIAFAGGALGLVARALSGPDRNVELVAPVTSEGLPPSDDAWPDLAGLPTEVTSAEEHYVVDINLIKPSVDADDWSLRVFGEVDEELTFAFDELQERFEIVEEYSVMTCISNEVGGNLIGTSLWGGVRLRDVLESAGVGDGVVDLILRGADGYSDSIPIDVAMNEHVLIAVSQNGEPLTQAHGFPCRLRVPAIYGMKNVKWLESIELVSNDYKGYWMERGWSDTAVVKTESRIDVLGDDGSATVGEDTWIAGVAWAGERGISKVEISTDGGRTWDEALLKDPINERMWRFWAYRWTPRDAVEVEIVCRATDGDGGVQTMRETEPHPSGASGYPSRSITVSQA
ncbi:MAG: molybdopterin-dependent oxidoreductase [Actinomycetota bacterium]